MYADRIDKTCGMNAYDIYGDVINEYRAHVRNYYVISIANPDNRLFVCENRNY